MSLVSRVVPLFFLLSLSPSSIRSSEIIKTLQELNPGPADSETTRYLLPKLAEKYSKYMTDLSRARGGGDGGTEDTWDEYVYDPKLFLLTETEEEGPGNNNYGDYRDKREAKMFREGGGGGLGGNNNMIRGNNWNKGPSLSIVNPLDVLRQRLMLEIARRRQEKSQNQIDKNREILSNLGKRNYFQSQKSRGERRSGEGGEWELRNWQPSVFEPVSSSFSRWSSRSLAEFPHSETHDLDHRTYNRHVN
ncbi:hypothetical protein WDU94_002685 [Cyamophila willieti]